MEWTQTRDDISITIPASKNVKVEIKPTHLLVCVGDETVINGTLYKSIRAGDAVWFLDNGVLKIELPKITFRRTDEQWWPYICENLPTVNIEKTKIKDDPKLSELDQETKMRIEKNQVENFQRLKV